MGMLTTEQRSYCMSRITSKNTKPELMFRKAVWGQGIRGYRLHAKLPGKPDLFFPKKRVAIFIDGCFWHHCPDCFVRPKSNNDYWDKKIERNTNRDVEVNKSLQNDSITVVRLWEHEVKKSLDKSLARVESVLSAQNITTSF